ncbi:MAG TPA: DUF2680 domain-containing protein [Clostridia bacterium]|nr:DUF2680 domain-containing protein [Clostridia bacterium]
MKNMKKFVAVMAAVGILGTAGVAYAATVKTPAEIAAGVTGKTVEEVAQERVAGKTYGTIANDAGKLDEFKAQMLEQKKAVLAQRVKDGTLTQQQADDIYNTIKNNQANCTGVGNVRIGNRNGAGFGCGAGVGQGMGGRMGRGAGMGNRTGMGYGAGGSCLNQ